ncbi:hypothetical protein [Thermomonas brevis]|uniref:hypothetical protein n=1 Tax=Thermomonas brevis TaxID=215691 RepID=UPI001CB72D0A|nr:hypothetical protein [Thermomonas brevis]
MSDGYLQLRRIVFKGPKGDSNLDFISGVNVVCGASDTGKSFLAESIDYMLGGSELREIPERVPYGEVELDLCVSTGSTGVYGEPHPEAISPWSTSTSPTMP